MRYLTILILTIVTVESARIRRQSISFGSAPTSEPKACTTPDGKMGVCTKLFDCPPLYTRLRTNPSSEFITFLRESLCRSRGSVPILCCSIEVQPTTTTPSRSNFFVIGRSTTPKTTPSTKPPTTPEPIAPNKGDLEETTVSKVTDDPPEPITEAPKPPAENPPVGRTIEEILPKFCGVPNVTSTTTRIVGGRIAEKGAWPWLVALGYRTKNEIEFLCGGALITDRHILTAAHCVDQRTDLEVIRLGEHDLDRTDEAEHEDITVSKVAAHTQYDSSNFENDVAVITMAKPVTFKKNIIPGCLPLSERLATIDLTRKRAFVAGWGSIAYNNVSSPVLKEAMVPIRTNEKCQESYEKFKSIVINEQRLCAGDGGDDACQGDSGGPLMMYDFEEDKYYLLGIVSVGFRCAEPDFPGIYTKVPAYTNWILEHLL